MQHLLLNFDILSAEYFLFPNALFILSVKLCASCHMKTTIKMTEEFSFSKSLSIRLQQVSNGQNKPTLFFQNKT